MELDGLWGPSQPKPFWDSVETSFWETLGFRNRILDKSACRKLSLLSAAVGTVGFGARETPRAIIKAWKKSELQQLCWIETLNKWQRNTLLSKPSWSETAHCSSFLFPIHFTCLGPIFYNSWLDNIHYLPIHEAIQPGPTQARTWCFPKSKSSSASLCQRPSPPSHHHHHHAWTITAT